jgi:hypothetical protein
VFLRARPEASFAPLGNDATPGRKHVFDTVAKADEKIDLAREYAAITWRRPNAMKCAKAARANTSTAIFRNS